MHNKRITQSLLKCFAIINTVLLSVHVYAQDKTLTMKDAIVGYHLYPRGVNQLQWADDNTYAYIDTANREQIWRLVFMDDTRLNTTKVVRLSDLQHGVIQAGMDSLVRLPSVKWLTPNVMRFYHQGKYIRYDLSNHSVEKLLEYDGAQMAHADINFESNHVAYVKDDNLFVDATQITTDGGNGIVYGQAVHRSEFGITNGTFWHPKGKLLAFYRMDESMVTEYPLYNLSSKPATAKNIRYPVAGDKSHHVTIGVYNTVTGKVIYLNTGEPLEQYLTNISWGPKGDFIYVAVVNRAQNHMWLKKFNATTGAFVKTLFEETSDKYVEPEHPMTFMPNDPSQFIWWSERDGYTHLYLYDTTGQMIRQLTKGPWEVTDFYGFDDDKKVFYIECTKESPINRDLYAVKFKKNSKMFRLTANEGTHRVTPSPTNYRFIDNFSSTLTPREVRIINQKGQMDELVKRADNPLEDYKLGAMTIGTIKSTDGTTDLYYRLFQPVDFDPLKKYPVVVYLYNGPHAQMIRNSWLGGANLWFQYMAQQGYVVFTVDGRGSANRGFEFESAIHRQVGTLEMEDQLAGANFLKSLPWVDGDRMGIHGWSYGGFMTTSMMTRKPGTFKVGVAGGPVIDWNYYEIMYTERYMDSPEENPEGYKNNNLLNYVDKLEGKLLMIHGGQDDVVLWQHSLMYLEENIKSGNTNLDYFVYPHHPHNVGGMDRVHLYQKVTDYLNLYLK